MLRTLVALLVAPTLAVAGTRLEMKRGAPVGIVVGCRDVAEDITHVVVELRDNRTVDIRATGSQSDRRATERRWTEGHTIHQECHETRATTAWTTRWTGRWTMTRDTLTLDLVLAGDSCKYVESTPLMQPRLSCKKASKQTRITCSRVDNAWRCNTPGLGQTPPWVLERR